MKKIALFLSLILLLGSSCAPRKQASNYYKVIMSSSKVANSRPLWPKQLPQWVPNGFPLRTPEVVIPVWIAPYINRDGDLVDAHYVYMVIKHPAWIYEEDVNGKKKP